MQFVPAFAIIAVLTIALTPPLADPPTLRALVDARTVLGVPNFWNVASNLPLLLVGAWGVFVARRARFIDATERWPYLVAFLAIALSGAGSAYYHLVPLDAQLMWDRLPIALSFMALICALAGDRLGGRTAVELLGPALILGTASVLYWRWTALHGEENIVPYVLVQYGGLLVIVALAARVPSRYTRTPDVLVAVLIYVLAKIAELLDAPVYSVGALISGHTLKHLLAALAAWWVLRMIELRDAVRSPPDEKRSAAIPPS